MGRKNASPEENFAKNDEIEMQNHSPDNMNIDGIEVLPEKEEVRKKRSCCSKVVHAIWRTRWTEDSGDDKERYVRTTLRELFIYIIFIVILCILTFGMTSSSMYYFTKVMQDLFVESPGFKAYTKQDDFWDYAKKDSPSLLTGLYWENKYNGDPLPEDKKGYIYYENRLLGLPRLRQLRVRGNSCEVHEEFRKEIKNCYAHYNKYSEDKAPFGLQNGTAWVYQSEEKLGGMSFWGKMADYGGGGYTQLLSNTSKDASEKVIQGLKKNHWIDRGTRAVMVDFTVYNANINLFCIVKLILEYPPTGGAIPHWNFRTLKLIRYVSNFDYFVLGCEIAFIVFILYYMVEEAIEIRKHKWGYFKEFWNLLDVIVIILSIVAVAFNMYRTLVVTELLQGLLTNNEQYANFEFLGFWQMRYNDLVAIVVFASWLKIFKYISFNKTMTQLQNTLGRCAKDIAGFAVMFFIIFLAFAQLGYLVFGTQVKDFSTMYNSIFTLFRIILGDFDFGAIETANRVLGPIFFLTYVFFVFFVLLNMFLAIINDTYGAVKEELDMKENEYEISDYFKQRYKKLKGKLTFRRKKIVDNLEALQLADQDGDNTVDYEEWHVQLTQMGHKEEDIQAIFAKYDSNSDRKLTRHEMSLMQADLEGQQATIDEEIAEIDDAEDHRATEEAIRAEDDSDSSDRARSSLNTPRRQHRRGTGAVVGGVAYEEFTVLSRRVDRVEHSIGSIVSKVDSVLMKLETLDKGKGKRRETISKLITKVSEDDKKLMGDAAKSKSRSKEVMDILTAELNDSNQSTEAEQLDRTDQSGLSRTSSTRSVPRPATQTRKRGGGSGEANV